MKKILLTGVIIIALFLAGGFLLKSALFPPPEVKEVTPTPPIAFPTVTSDVKVSLTSKNNNRVVKLVIMGIPDGTQTIEYEMKYMTSSGLIHGFGGTIRLTKGEREVERDDLTIGSCSSGGKCTYDEGVTSIDTVLKFNSPNGSSIFQKSFPL